MSSEEDFNLPVLPKSRGRRSGEATLEVLRELTEDDLPMLAQRSKTPTQAISKIRHSHHQLARLIAQGTSNEETALITGYDPAYISRIKNEDPAFKELVAHYAGVDEDVQVDVIRRMRTLGLTAVEVLQERIDAAPDSFSHREAMELVKLNLVEPMQRTGGVNPSNVQGAGAVQVNLNFVASPAAPKIIDAEPSK